MYQTYKSIFESEKEIIIDGYLILSRCAKIKSLQNITEIHGGLYIDRSNITSLGKLRYIGDDFYMIDTYLESLGNLKKIDGSLNAKNSYLKDLGELEYIGNFLNIQNTDLDNLGKIKTIKGSLYLNDKITNLDNLKIYGYVYGFKGDKKKYPSLFFYGDH